MGLKNKMNKDLNEDSEEDLERDHDFDEVSLNKVKTFRLMP